MNFLNFVAWLTAGAVIGWLASRMVEAEKRQAQRPCACRKAQFFEEVDPQVGFPAGWE